MDEIKKNGHDKCFSRSPFLTSGETDISKTVCNFMMQTAGCEPHRLSVTQDCRHMIRSANTHYRFTSNLELFLFWAVLIPPKRPIIHSSLKSLLIWSLPLRLGFPGDLFLSDFLTKCVYAFFYYPVCTSRPIHLILLIWCLIV